MATVGIWLGDTDCTVSIMKGDDLTNLMPHSNSSTFPFYVSITQTGVIWGDSAKSALKSNPETTMYYLRRLIGRDFNDPYVVFLTDKVTFQIVGIKERVHIYLDLDGKNVLYTPEAIVTVYLSELKKHIESEMKQFKDDIIKYVFTVPNYFTNRQILTLKMLLEIINFTNPEIIYESDAAAAALYGSLIEHSFTLGLFNVSSDEISVSNIQIYNNAITTTSSFTIRHENEAISFLGEVFAILFERQYNKKQKEKYKIPEEEYKWRYISNEPRIKVMFEEIAKEYLIRYNGSQQKISKMIFEPDDFYFDGKLDFEELFDEFSDKINTVLEFAEETDYFIFTGFVPECMDYVDTALSVFGSSKQQVLNQHTFIYSSGAAIAGGAKFAKSSKYTKLRIYPTLRNDIGFNLDGNFNVLVKAGSILPLIKPATKALRAAKRGLSDVRMSLYERRSFETDLNDDQDDDQDDDNYLGEIRSYETTATISFSHVFNKTKEKFNILFEPKGYGNWSSQVKFVDDLINAEVRRVENSEKKDVKAEVDQLRRLFVIYQEACDMINDLDTNIFSLHSAIEGLKNEHFLENTVVADSSIAALRDYSEALKNRFPSDQLIDDIERAGEQLYLVPLCELTHY